MSYDPGAQASSVTSFISGDTVVALRGGLPITGPISALSVGGGSSTTPVTAANSGTSYALAVPPSGNAAYDVTLTAGCAFTLSGGTSGQLQHVTLIIRGGAGGFTATLPTGVKWPGGRVPVVDTSAGSVNKFVMETPDGGSTYIGSY